MFSNLFCNDYSVLASRLYSKKNVNVPNYTKLQKHQSISLISQCDNHKLQNQIPAQIAVESLVFLDDCAESNTFFVMKEVIPQFTCF